MAGEREVAAERLRVAIPERVAGRRETEYEGESNPSDDDDDDRIDDWDGSVEVDGVAVVAKEEDEEGVESDLSGRDVKTIIPDEVAVVLVISAFSTISVLSEGVPVVAEFFFVNDGGNVSKMAGIRYRLRHTIRI